jgi:hypothetical protein
MPNPNVSFQGATLIIPNAYYADNVAAATNNTPPTTPPLIFIAQGYGPQSETIQQFASSQNLFSAMRGGPGADFVQFISNPSPQLNGAQLVTFISVGASTQSALTLSSAVTGLVTLTSTLYGVPSNLLQASVLVTANTPVSGVSTSVLTLNDNYAGAQITSPPLGPVFQFAYTGAASGVTYTIAASGGLASSIVTSGGTAGQNLTIPLGTGGYGTTQAVVDFLNSTGIYSAAVLGDGNMPANLLNTGTGSLTPPTTGGVLTFAVPTAYAGSIDYWVNTYASAFATAALASGATFAASAAPVQLPFGLFAGATSVPPTTQDYANAFNIALTTPGWTVVADSNSPAVQALGAQHAQTASELPNSTWRRFFTGNPVGTAVSGAVFTAISLDSITSTLVYPGIYRTDPNTGKNRLYSALYAAAAVAAMATGNIIATPLTNKALSANGVEVPLTVSQINILQQSGVMAIRVPSQTNVPTITSDLTTWQLDSNPENIFNQQVACRFWLGYSLSNAMSNYIGSIASPVTEVAILNAVKATLNALIYTTGSNGVISSWDPASLVLVYTGATQTANVTVNVTLVGQNRFITVFVPIQPLNFTLTATAA